MIQLVESLLPLIKLTAVLAVFNFGLSKMLEHFRKQRIAELTKILEEENRRRLETMKEEEND